MSKSYVFRTPPQKEFKAAEMFRLFGQHVFVPSETKMLRQRGRRRRKSERLYPLMTGYIILSFADGIPWGWLRQFHGHYWLAAIGVNGRPAALTPACVRHLAEISGQTVPWLASHCPHRAFTAGMMARIGDHHPFGGYESVIESIEGDRAKMLLKFLGEHEVEIPLDDLEAA